MYMYMYMYMSHVYDVCMYVCMYMMYMLILLYKVYIAFICMQKVYVDVCRRPDYFSLHTTFLSNVTVVEANQE